MHISEGILSWPVTAFGWVAAGVAVTNGLKYLQGPRLARCGLAAAAFFVASTIHLPLGPSSIHLVLTGLVGILLGPAAPVAIVCALALQALLFGYGGLVVLGPNTAIMSLPALAAWAIWTVTPKASARARSLGAFSAGFAAVAASVALVYAALVATDVGLASAGALFAWPQLALGLIEGVVCAVAVQTLWRAQVLHVPA